MMNKGGIEIGTLQGIRFIHNTHSENKMNTLLI